MYGVQYIRIYMVYCIAFIEFRKFVQRLEMNESNTVGNIIVRNPLLYNLIYPSKEKSSEHYDQNINVPRFYRDINHLTLNFVRKRRKFI